MRIICHVLMIIIMIIIIDTLQNCHLTIQLILIGHPQIHQINYSNGIFPYKPSILGYTRMTIETPIKTSKFYHFVTILDWYFPRISHESILKPQGAAPVRSLSWRTYVQ